MDCPVVVEVVRGRDDLRQFTGHYSQRQDGEPVPQHRLLSVADYARLGLGCYVSSSQSQNVKH